MAAPATPERIALLQGCWQRFLNLAVRDRRYLPTPEQNEAREKSIALLKEWLTPAQREQYDRHGDFVVVGGDTGRRYRISKPGTYSIAVLAGEDVVDRICVVPEGITADGDIMLAQKIWLEKDEKATLAIANSMSGFHL